MESYQEDSINPTRTEFIKSDQHTHDHTSEKSTEEFDVDIPLDNSKCFLLKPTLPTTNLGTVYFKSDYDFMREVEIQYEKRIDKDLSLDWKDKKFRSYCVLYKAYKNLPECINLPTKTNGVIRTKSFLKANLIWKLLKIEKMSNLIKSLNKYQRYNHFPCTWQLGRKDNLCKNYKIMHKHFPADYNYLPATYILPEDKDKFLKKVNNEPKAMWIIKPVSSSRGRGIRLMTNKESIPKKCLISRYISDPHLINNKKYDLRLYILITGFSPLKIYLYEEGLVRFASEEYNIEDNNMHNRFMHLTNYSVNKCSSRFDKSMINVENECVGSKWSLTALKNYFRNNDLDFGEMWKKIKDIVVKTVLTIAEESSETTKNMTKNNNSLFELYGFDVLIDSNLEPWLIEVNLNPSLNCDTDLDLKIKSSLMANIFNTVGLVPYSHLHKKNKNPKILTLFSKNSSIEDNSEIEEDSSALYSEEKNKINQKNDVSSNMNEDNSNLKSEIIEYSLEEFSRCGLFERVFPLKSNFEYYSKFLEKSDDENMILWNYIKNSVEEG